MAAPTAPWLQNERRVSELIGPPLYLTGVDANAGNCSICLMTLNEATDGPAWVLPCGHVFHSGCIRTAWRYRTACPYCKAHLDQRDLPPTVEEQRARVEAAREAAREAEQIDQDARVPRPVPVSAAEVLRRRVAAREAEQIDLQDWQRELEENWQRGEASREDARDRRAAAQVWTRGDYERIRERLNTVRDQARRDGRYLTAQEMDAHTEDEYWRSRGGNRETPDDDSADDDSADDDWEAALALSRQRARERSASPFSPEEWGFMMRARDEVSDEARDRAAAEQGASS